MRYEWATYTVGDEVRAYAIVDENGKEVLSVSMNDPYFIFEDGITDPSKSTIAQKLFNGLDVKLWHPDQVSIGDVVYHRPFKRTGQVVDKSTGLGIHEQVPTLIVKYDNGDMFEHSLRQFSLVEGEAP